MDEFDNGSSFPPRSLKHGKKENNNESDETSLLRSKEGQTSTDKKEQSDNSLSSQRHSSRIAEETDQQKSSPSKDKPIALSMLVLILAVFMAILDTSIVNVAIPKMMAVFGVNQNDIQWVLTAYTLVVGSVIPVTGFLGDRFGYKKIFMIALVVFTIGSGLCGAAWSNSSLVFFRIIQAIGGGALMPVSMAMIFRMIPLKKRGFAMGILGIAIMFAPAIGPTLSGYITEYLNWRLIFYINLPIGILDFFLAMVILDEFTTGKKHRFDFGGFFTSVIGFASLLYALGEVPGNGWGNARVDGFLVLACLSLLTFVILELNVKEPMLDLRLFKNVTFTLSIIITAIATIVLMGSLFLLPVFLQNVSGLSPIQTGLVLLPQALTAGVMMPIAGFLFDRIGVKPLAIVGLSLTAYSLYLTHYLNVDTATGTIVGWLIIRALGIGMVMMPMQTAGMNTVPQDKVGQGTAITNTARQVSASFGIAWMSLLLANRDTLHRLVNANQMSMFSNKVSNTVQQLQGYFLSVGQTASEAKSNALYAINGLVQQKSIVQAMDDVFYVSIFLAVAGVILALFMKSKKADDEHSAQLHQK